MDMDISMDIHAKSVDMDMDSRGVARGGQGRGASAPPRAKDDQFFVNKINKFIYLFASQLRCSQGRAPHDMVSPQAKNPSYAPG